MKIAFCSQTMYSGGQERMAMAVNRYTQHEARCLAPGVWFSDIPKGRRFKPHEKSDRFIYNYNIPAVRNAILEWADVIACVYTCSLHTMDRRDLLGKKICTWHLAIRWKHQFYAYAFPGDDIRQYRLLLSLEGWDRYNLGGLPFTIIPVIFNIEEPEFLPIAFEKRKRHVSMAPRTRISMDTDSSPRHANEVKQKLHGFPFRIIYHRGFRECMAHKKHAWVGIDDLYNPLTHLSGFEYCAVGVPCFNCIDDHLKDSFSKYLGCNSLPFLDADMHSIKRRLKLVLREGEDYWKEKSIEVRNWMEKYYHPKDMIQRYIEVFEKA